MLTNLLHATGVLATGILINGQPGPSQPVNRTGKRYVPACAALDVDAIPTVRPISSAALAKPLSFTGHLVFPSEVLPRVAPFNRLPPAPHQLAAPQTAQFAPKGG